MTLRTQLAGVFLLLAVVPLGAIVIHDYHSSQQAFRSAVASENEAMTRELEGRMTAVETELRVGVERLGQLFSQPTNGPTLPMAFGKFLEGTPALGGLLETVQFDRERPAGGEAPGQSWVIDVREACAFDTPPPPAADGPAPGAPTPPPPPTPPELAVAFRATGDVLTAFVRASKNLEKQFDPKAAANSPSAEEIEAEMRRAFDEAAAATAAHTQAGKEQAKLGLIRAREALDSERLAQLEQRAAETRRVLGHELSAPVKVGDDVVGTIHARIRADELLSEVLARSPRGRGEIPFAIDTEGVVHAADPADRERLDALGIAAGHDPEAWIVARRKDPSSGLTFGIARPIATSLDVMRRAAIRNFSIGLGLVGLALLGTFPLSGRMTRRLNRLTGEVERMAAGDLEARVPVDRLDEIGRLGETFNRMAADLRGHQQRLVTEGVEKRVLAAEHERKSRELEDARAFQLSLLPSTLPEHPHAELSVRMRTAAEVGGDTYDAVVADDGSLVLAVGDATGHGSRAGVLVSAFKMLFCADGGSLAPATFLDHAGGAIRRMGLARMHMGLTLVRFDGRTLTAAAAGMPPIWVVRNDSGQVEELAFEAMPLGGPGRFAYEERTIAIAPGDTVVLASDGLIEAQRADGEVYGFERLRASLPRLAGGSPEALVDGLLAEAETWLGGKPLEDDITVLVLRAK